MRIERRLQRSDCRNKRRLLQSQRTSNWRQTMRKAVARAIDQTLVSAVTMLSSNRCGRNEALKVICDLSIVKSLCEVGIRSRSLYGKRERKRLSKLYAKTKRACWLLIMAKVWTKEAIVSNGRAEDIKKLGFLYSSICCSLALTRRLMRDTRQSSDGECLDAKLYKGQYVIFLLHDGEVALVAYGAKELADGLGVGLRSARSRLSRCFPGKEGRGKATIVSYGIRYELEFVKQAR